MDISSTGITMIDKHYVLSALGYGILGVILGIYMAMSKNTLYMSVHAHLLVLGFLTSFIYALCYKIWLTHPVRCIDRVHFLLHQSGVLLFCVGIMLRYNDSIPSYVIGPMMGCGALFILCGLILMKCFFIQHFKHNLNDATHSL